MSDLTTVIWDMRTVSPSKSAPERCSATLWMPTASPSLTKKLGFRVFVVDDDLGSRRFHHVGNGSEPLVHLVVRSIDLSGVFIDEIGRIACHPCFWEAGPQIH